MDKTARKKKESSDKNIPVEEKVSDQLESSEEGISEKKVTLVKEKDKKEIEIIDEPVLESGQSVENNQEDEIEDSKESRKESFFFQGGKYSGSDPETTYSRKEKKSNNPFILGVIVFILTVIISSAAGFFILSSQDIEDKNVEETIVATPTVAPTMPPLDRSAWTFEVLNGSGKSGEAARVSEQLEELGYTVDSIGNAEEEIDTTQMYVEEGAEKEFEPILKELQETYPDWEVTDVLEDSEVRVRIIIGSE